MMRRPPRLPRPAIPHRILRTPPEPGMTDPTSGFSTSSRWSDEYSSSVRHCPTKRVNSLVSTKLIIRELYVNDVVRQDGEVCACGLTILGNRRAGAGVGQVEDMYRRVPVDRRVRAHCRSHCLHHCCSHGTPSWLPSI